MSGRGNHPKPAKEKCLIPDFKLWYCYATFRNCSKWKSISRYAIVEFRTSFPPSPNSIETVEGVGGKVGYSEISGPQRLPKNSSWHEPAAAPVGIPSSHTPTTISFSMQQCEIYFRTDAIVSVRTLGIEPFPFVAPRPPLLFSRQLAKNASTTTAATPPPPSNP